MYSIATWLNDLASVTHGTTVNKIPNVYGIANRTARAVLLDVDPKETQRIVQLAPVFNSVFDYACPSDVKGDRVIDIRPQAGRTPADQFTQGYEEDFDANKGVSFDNKIYTQWNTGVKSLRIEAPSLTAPVTLCDTSTLNGWSVSGGGIGSLSLDTTNNVAGGGALTFNLLAGQTAAAIQNSSLNAVDLSAYVNVSSGFLWVYLPSGSAISGVTVQWGSKTSAYYNYTATVRQDGTAFQNGWNLIQLPWASATLTGTPTNTAYAYALVGFLYNGTPQTGVKVCNLTFGLGSIFEAVYYSKYLFRDPSTNAFQETVVDNTDNNKIINLDTESYNLFFNKSAYFVAQALQGADAEYDANFFGGQDGLGGEYGNALKRYRALNPSEAIIKATSYYPMPRRGYYPFG